MIDLMKLIRESVEIKVNNILMNFEHGHIERNLILSKQKRISRITRYLKSIFPEETISLDTTIENTFKEFQEEAEIRLEREYRPNHVYFDDKCIINLTDIRIPEDVLLGLSFGPKFCFPPQGNIDDIIELLDDFGNTIENNFPVETHLEAYKQFSIEIRKENRFHSLTQSLWLSFLNYRITDFRHKYPDIIIMKSDKGKHTVLIERRKYVEKMNQLVISTEDYVYITEIKIDELEKKNNIFANKLLSIGAINDNIDVKDRCTVSAKMYGLIKVHKENFPVRPITSACASPGFKMAKFITNILSRVFIEDGFHVKNSISFVNKIREIDIDENEIMISFDVVSMFTNIPILLMIQLIGIRRSEIQKHSGIHFELFREILIFLLKECAVFQWNDKSYKQRDSLAMGSPLSPILAKILMNRLLDVTLPKLKDKPKFLALYVDDSFWIVKNGSETTILHQLNQYHEKIKFTLEKENGSKINFLDVTVHRRDNHLLTNWYKKPFASSRLINYFSGHEKACVFETASAFVRMVLNLSDGVFFQQNKLILEDILKKNNFPLSNIIGIMHENYSLMKGRNPNDKYTGKYIPIKYRAGFTQRLKKKIEPFLFNQRIIGTPDRSNSRHFSQLKDATKIEDRSNVVILFLCACKKKVIIRHTEYLSKVGDMHSNILHTFDNVETCSEVSHSFEKARVIQCKNYSSMKRTYEMYSYLHKDKLYKSVLKLPMFSVANVIRGCSNKNFN